MMSTETPTVFLKPRFQSPKPSNLIVETGVSSLEVAPPDQVNVDPAWISQMLDMSVYKHLLKLPKKNMQSTDKILDDLISQRVSKIEFSMLESGSQQTLAFNQGCQTTITGGQIDKLSQDAGFRRAGVDIVDNAI